MEIYNKFRKTFPNLALATLARELEDELSDCDSVLDVGCGENSPIRLISKRKKSTGVDAYKPALERSKKAKIHDHYVNSDVLKLNNKFKEGSFDAVIALDVIEHLKKKDGDKLLRLMENIAKKKVIFLTPNGFIEQHDDDNDLQEHLSGWSIKDFLKRGYEVKGMYGLKFLRGEKASLRYSPKILSGIVSELSHYIYTKTNPKYSFSLFAVKKVNEK